MHLVLHNNPKLLIYYFQITSNTSPDIILNPTEAGRLSPQHNSENHSITDKCSKTVNMKVDAFDEGDKKDPEYQSKENRDKNHCAR